MYSTLRFELGGDGVALATIDVPGGSTNVIGEVFRNDLAALVERVVGDAAVKGVVLTSAKSDFMAGGDIKAMVETFSRPMTREQAWALATSMSPVLRRLETCGKPFAAAINGPAMGGGMELALACHYRVISNDPKAAMALPEATLGLMPGSGGTQRLPRLIGIGNALPLILEGTRLSAADALDKGIVHAMAAPEDIVATARDWIVGRGNPVQPWDTKGFKIPGGSGFMDPDLGNLYNLTATQIARDTQRNLPAPIAVLNAVARGTAVPIDAGLRIESCAFAELILNPVARNIARTMFVSKGELDKLVRRPAGVPTVKYTSIGVLGAGLMGSGLAHSAAACGLQVVLLDTTDETAHAGKQRIADDLGKRVAKGRMAQDKADTILGRIFTTSDHAQLADCQVVVEAVFEDMEVKRDVFRAAQKSMRPGAILASNTSTLPITSLAEGLECPDRFIGLHFFSPVDRMPLVEIVVGTRTSDATLAESLDLVKALRKTPIVVRDSRGFFTSRVISVYLQEAFAMLAEGIKPALIDNAAKMAGFAIGPLALMDDIGMDNGWKAAQAEKAALGAAWKETAGYRVQKMFCETLDRRGRRYGKGFYDYPAGQRALWPGLAEVYPSLPQQPAVKEVKQRLLFIQSLEAVRCLDEGVLGSVAEGDVGSVLGIGFPGYTGGVFSLVDTMGAKAFVQACDSLADRHGQRYRPSASLRARAESGELFYPLLP